MADGDREDPLLGQTLDQRYRVRRLLGRGGMGAVYEAEHVGLDKRVAVKVITSTGHEPQALARFRREARAAGQITDAHVVQIFDVGTDASGRDFIAMEYVEGRELRSVIADGPLAPGRAIAIAEQILDGLAAIHAAGIVHRDIKPGNILLGDDDFVKLMDFGISRSERERDQLTESGHVIGTPEYMAPEQLSGLEVDHRADLYAVGLVVFEMLAGKPPFQAASFSELAAMQLRDDPPALDTVRDDLPPHLGAAVARALEKRPADRFADARAFADALAGRRPTTAATRAERPRATPPPVRRPRWHWNAAILAIAGGVTIGLAIRLRGHDAPAPRPPADAATPDPLAAARVVERANPELAIARYIEAYDATRDPNVLFRIGELYEQLDRVPDAVRYFQRYLDASPGAPDRAAVVARIARLAPPPPPDAGVPDAPPRPAQAKPVKPGRHCQCFADSKEMPYFMCHQKRTMLCRCVQNPSRTEPLCPTRFVACPDNACPGGHVGITIGTKAFSCSDPDYREFHLRGKPEDRCQGYDPLHISSTGDDRLLDGVFACDVCANLHDSTASGIAQFDYVGEPGEPCTGYNGHLETPQPGHIVCEAHR